ncbi:serine protease AprX [Clostridium acetireducens DSM 10703]|uniref:Serine protease AprX n=1 Tax=Clostridium acetireducens DSM 10703 TaxID=1121290 RepID=A0A1E8F006_9CLOT|nr:S8 family serine peptidase [Clostridium acetireducens]OFI06612.1 serine protease AprX [Clostridium acetireducens DSM 10703]
MFSIKNKLDKNLKISIENKYYKYYRVLIICKNMQKKVENKIKIYKGTIIHSIPIINCICAKLSPYTINRILEYPQVEYVTYDNQAIICGKSVASANNIYINNKYKLTGKDIGIGIVDTGVFPHRDLLNPKNKICKFLDLINKYQYPYDDNGHGTFISGIICGSGYSSKGVYKGIAENSHIYSIKAFNSLGRAFVSDILYSIQTLIKESKEHNIKIICLPFEILNNDYNILSLFSNIFDKAIKNNIIIIVPSGNNGNFQGSIQGIATLKNCITVGGLDTTSSNIKSYEFSSAGPFNKLEKPNLSAACVNICSLNCDNQYISERNGMKIYPNNLELPYTCYTGTSCSAAFISGVCALLYENNPQLTFNDILSLLKVSCKLVNVSKWIQGNGVIDINSLLP